MIEKAAAVLAAFTVTASLMPSAYANTFVNEAFVGSYLSAGATSDNYASLDILSCTDTSVSVRFKFVKNNNEQLIYECLDGTMDDNKGTIRFNVSYQDGSYVTGGTMVMTLDSWCVRLSCDSDQGQHLFDGIMYPQFTLDPYTAPTQPPTFVDTTPAPDLGITVMLNNAPVSFPVSIRPTIINDYTYVPLRSVFDDMGINVYWDDYQRTDILRAQSITCTKNSTIVQFLRTFNESGYNVWSLSKWENADTSSSTRTEIPITDLQPVIINDRTYVPLRVISEAFGAQVDWDGNTKTVYITCDTSNMYKHDSATITNIENFTLDAAQSYITSDYSEISADPVPYYSADTKFYNFDARDQWNPVTLRISFGGYVDLSIRTDAAESAPAADTSVTETAADSTTESTVETPADTTGTDAADQAAAPAA